MGLKGRRHGEIYKLWRPGNSKLTEGVKWFRSMLASESKSFAASDALWVDVEAPRYMVLVKTISTRDDCELKKVAYRRLSSLGSMAGVERVELTVKGIQESWDPQSGWWW